MRATRESRGERLLPPAALAASVLALLLLFACFAFAGCWLRDDRMEEEFRKGYQAGQAAAEAASLESRNGMEGEEAQALLSQIGEGKGSNLEFREYSLQEDRCQVYGLLHLADGSALDVYLVLEKKDGIWKIVELRNLGQGNGAGAQ
ncbi:MAG: hypothetical protein H5T73_10570 [Actinobacteria bacterium]|nr:hypothetical protein [Actinomycetota bacterium]